MRTKLTKNRLIIRKVENSDKRKLEVLSISITTDDYSKIYCEHISIKELRDFLNQLEQEKK